MTLFECSLLMKIFLMSLRQDCVRTNITERFEFHEFYWIPKMTADKRKETYSSIFWTISKRMTHFHNSIIAENEIRVHHNTPESKWNGVIIIYRENKVQSHVIRGKIMVTVFYCFFFFLLKRPFKRWVHT